MLSPEYLAGIADDLVELYAELDDDISADIARRIVKMGYVTDTAAWQIEKAREAGALRGDAEKKIAKMANISEKELERLMAEAGIKSIAYDDAIYKLAGLAPLGLSKSPALSAILSRGVDSTQTLLNTYTQTRALETEVAFRNLSDKAYLQIMSGAFDPTTAIRNAIKELATQDVSKVAYPSGASHGMESAVRRAVTTGVNQSVSKLQLARAEEMGCQLVEVSSHAGARPDHAVWQGKIYCISGKHKRYKDFYEATGYGTGPGLCGWNCHHSFYPYFEGLSTPSFSRDPSSDMGHDNGKDYELSQEQRYMERQIRAAKKECVTYNAAMEKADKGTAAEIKKDFDAAAVKLKRREDKLQTFLDETGRTRLTDRESVPGFGHSVSSKAVWANRKANE